MKLSNSLLIPNPPNLMAGFNAVHDSMSQYARTGTVDVGRWAASTLSGAVMGGLGAKLGSVSRAGGEGAKKVSSQAGTMGLVGMAAGFTSGVVQQAANLIRGKEISVSSIYLEAMAGGIGGGIAGKIIGKSQAPGWWRVVGGGALSGGIAGGIGGFGHGWIDGASQGKTWGEMFSDGLKGAADGIVHGTIGGAGMAAMMYRRPVPRKISEQESNLLREKGRDVYKTEHEGKPAEFKVYEGGKSILDNIFSALIHNPLVKQSGMIHRGLSAAAEWMGLQACFAKGSKIYAKGIWGIGWKEIEDITTDDWVLSRNEYDPEGVVEWKWVEETFQRLGRVWEVIVGGRLVRTTGEHPFYEEVKGWINAQDLEIGDRLLTREGIWQTVAKIEDTNTYETVYNLRVADWHTYFVGAEDWGWGLWAHNATYSEQENILERIERIQKMLQDPSTRVESLQIELQQLSENLKKGGWLSVEEFGFRNIAEPLDPKKQREAGFVADPTDLIGKNVVAGVIIDESAAGLYLRDPHNPRSFLKTRDEIQNRYEDFTQSLGEPHQYQDRLSEIGLKVYGRELPSQTGVVPVDVLLAIERPGIQIQADYVPTGKIDGQVEGSKRLVWLTEEGARNPLTLADEMGHVLLYDSPQVKVNDHHRVTYSTLLKKHLSGELFLEPTQLRGLLERLALANEGK